LVGGGLFIRLHTLSPQITVSLPVSKDQILAKMQEFDAILQATVKVQSELWSMMSILPDSTELTDFGIPLTFNENGHIISWRDKSERFTPSVFRLLQQLWFDPDRFLSKEDVCQDVIGDEYASDGAIRHVLCDARKETEKVGFPYVIETVWGKGYKLKEKEQPFPI